MTDFDGQKQRNALTAVERTIEALAAGDADRARKNAAKAAELDQIAVFAALPAAVAQAADDIDTHGAVSGASWDALAELVGPGPLQAEIDALRP